MFISLAANSVNSNDRGQIHLRVPKNAYSQKEKCSTSQGPPTPMSTISSTTVKGKGKRRDRNRTTLTDLDKFFKERAAKDKDIHAKDKGIHTESSSTNSSITGTKSEDDDDHSTNPSASLTPIITPVDKEVDVKDSQVSYIAHKETPTMNKQEKVSDNVENNNSKSIIAIPEMKAAPANDEVELKVTMSAQTCFQAQTNVEELKKRAFVNEIINNIVTDATKKLFKCNLGSVGKDSEPAPNTVNSKNRGQKDLKTQEDTHFQSDKCLSKAIGNPTSQEPPIPASKISSTTVQAKGKRRDRNRTTLAGLDQFFKQRATKDKDIDTDSSYKNVSVTGTKSGDNDANSINPNASLTTIITPVDKDVDVKDSQVSSMAHKETPTMNKQGKVFDNVENNNSKSTTAVPEIKAAPANDEVELKVTMSAQKFSQARANLEELKTRTLISEIINNIVTNATKRCLNLIWAQKMKTSELLKKMNQIRRNITEYTSIHCQR